MDIERAKLTAIVRLFDEAEAKVKEVERLSSELSVPSINELRYVGYHLTKALSEETDDKIASELHKAERHCKRAIYDAIEIGIIYLLEKIQVFQEDYQLNTEIITVIPDYIELRTGAHDAQDFISRIREDCAKDRDRYYEECQPHYEALKTIYRKLDLSRTEINKLTNSATQAERKKWRQFIVQVIIGLIALSVSLTIAYRIYNPVPPTPQEASEVTPQTPQK